MLTGRQIRAARAMMKIDQAELARLAGISVETIKRYERNNGKIDGNLTSLYGIVSAFSKMGLEFIEHGELSAGGIGVRLSLSNTEKVENAVKGAYMDKITEWLNIAIAAYPVEEELSNMQIEAIFRAITMKLERSKEEILDNIYKYIEGDDIE